MRFSRRDGDDFPLGGNVVFRKVVGKKGTSVLAHNVIERRIWMRINNDLRMVYFCLSIRDVPRNTYT